MEYDFLYIDRLYYILLYGNIRRKKGVYKDMVIKVGKKKLYSVKDLSLMLPITPLTIREYIRKGKLKGHKIGKNWYVTKENLSLFLEGPGNIREYIPEAFKENGTMK
jgi:hypothetical protein